MPGPLPAMTTWPLLRLLRPSSCVPVLRSASAVATPTSDSGSSRRSRRRRSSSPALVAPPPPATPAASHRGLLHTLVASSSVLAGGGRRQRPVPFGGGQGSSARVAADASTSSGSGSGGAAYMHAAASYPSSTRAVRSFSFSFSSSSAGGGGGAAKPAAARITCGSDRQALEELLASKLHEPLGFLDEGTLSMWRGQEPHVRCLYYAAEGDDGELLGFLTVYEVERDPLGKHERPHLLNLLFVQRKYRRTGVAVELIRRAASELQVTALCTSEEYVEVCGKAGLQRGDSGALAPLVVMAN